MLPPPSPAAAGADGLPGDIRAGEGGFYPGPMPGLRCRCGSDMIAAVAPGTDGDAALDLFAVPLTFGVPARVWCVACWRREFLAE